MVGFQIHWLTSSLICDLGILKNVAPVPPPSIVATIDLDKEVILPALHPVLSSISLQQVSQNVQDLVAQEVIRIYQQCLFYLTFLQDAIPAIDKLSIKNAPQSDHKSPPELELERLELQLRTIQLSLEILTSICATLPDPDPVQDDVDVSGEADGEFVSLDSP